MADVRCGILGAGGLVGLGWAGLGWADQTGGLGLGRWADGGAKVGRAGAKGTRTGSTTHTSAPSPLGRDILALRQGRPGSRTAAWVGSLLWMVLRWQLRRLLI